MKTIVLLTIITFILGIIINAAKIVLLIFSSVVKKRRNIRNSKPNKVDLIIRNRPGNYLDNYPHQNDGNKNRSQYPKYFE